MGRSGQTQPQNNLRNFTYMCVRYMCDRACAGYTCVCIMRVRVRVYMCARACIGGPMQLTTKNFNQRNMWAEMNEWCATMEGHGKNKKELIEFWRWVMYARV